MPTSPSAILLHTDQFFILFCTRLYVLYLFYIFYLLIFFILGKHVVFGKVTPESMGTLRKIEGLGTPSGKTKTKVTITASEVTGMDDLEIQCTDMEI